METNVSRRPVIWSGATAAALLLVGPVQASVHQLKQANRLFEKGQYDDALKIYNDALVDKPHSSILHFNAGDAAYQMGDFPKAEKEFKEAAETGIPLLRSA